ncbi:hypothetical protein DI09_112p70 [Mitosporidium daphniae]|uniref:ATP-dependent RNA helicase n=1 Tax=Mitosporidium daphniae TaxID=1485682 RepID=A0A098VVB3_9MICR|nr:uncharacterized protein DI09_112p70 [Mitosporidium daphniae]KGG53073.1 hypothetical protein DI09_112p70 [Mitosporidium daphniae]|eukprot:XP_013239509.1 uncharacterized protein DI09_112p70 [Mitosporidium daphniae]
MPATSTTHAASMTRSAPATDGQGGRQAASRGRGRGRPRPKQDGSLEKGTTSNENSENGHQLTHSSANAPEIPNDWKEGLVAPERDPRIQTELGLLKGLFELGYESPSPIQAVSLPATLSGRNVLARAKNGTGKTASFLIPVLQTVNPRQCAIQALILVPTRELALQTSSLCRKMAAHLTGIETMVSTGGTILKEDIVRLASPIHIIVATPGRILDLARREIAVLTALRILVLDEADKLLAPEFEGIISDLLSLAGCGPQILLFSATFPRSVEHWASRHMTPQKITAAKANPNGGPVIISDPTVAPVLINLMDELTLRGVTQFYAYVEERQKVHCLNTLFSKLAINQSIIFCSSAPRVELLARKITTELGVSAFFLHSRMPQEHRNQIFHDFRSGSARNLVTTDLLTRGIDVATVNVVVNFDFPKNAETYLHRIGRSGRFGHRGIAISLVTYEDRHRLFEIEAALGTEIQPMPATVDRALYAQ